MELRGQLAEISRDILSRKYKVSFLVEDTDLKELEELNNIDLRIVATKFKKKRSIDANAYMWVLCGKLANKLGDMSTEVYKKFIREVGVYEVLPVRNEALQKFTDVWNDKGIGWFCDTFPSKLEGYTNVKAYYGSSSYDTAEMSRLINEVVNECKEQGIQTELPGIIEKMLEEWK